MHRLLII